MSEEKSSTKKPQSGGEKESDKRMPFVDHLEELRTRLFYCIGSIFAFGIIAYIFSQQLLDVVTAPKPDDIKLISLAPQQMFIVHIKVSFYAGVILSIPVLIYQFWQFVAPGLFPKERKMLFPVIFFTLFCFVVGGMFAYFIVIPNGLMFLASFETEEIAASWSIDKYMSFVTMLIMVFGVVFEIPLLATFLGKIGFINHKMLRRFRKYSIIGAVILGAVLTPPDGFTQIALAVPLWILYELSIFLVKMVEPKEEDEDDDEDYEDVEDDDDDKD